MKIKKGDHVVVTAGKDKGATGTVIAAYPDKNKVLVQGVNMSKINKKVTNQGVRGAKEGGITTQEAPIHVSNVMVIGPDDTPTRIGYRKDEEGRSIRVSRRTGKDL
jgi:large subunit ribosomal protein L24